MTTARETMTGDAECASVDGHQLVGVLSQADIAKNLPEEYVGDLVEAISSVPSNR